MYYVETLQKSKATAHKTINLPLPTIIKLQLHKVFDFRVILRYLAKTETALHVKKPPR